METQRIISVASYEANDLYHRLSLHISETDLNQADYEVELLWRNGLVTASDSRHEHWENAASSIFDQTRHLLSEGRELYGHTPSKADVQRFAGQYCDLHLPYDPDHTVVVELTSPKLLHWNEDGDFCEASMSVNVVLRSALGAWTINGEYLIDAEDECFVSKSLMRPLVPIEPQRGDLWIQDPDLFRYVETSVNRLCFGEIRNLKYGEQWRRPLTEAEEDYLTIQTEDPEYSISPFHAPPPVCDYSL